jgi:hypothetical protein
LAQHGVNVGAVLGLGERALDRQAQRINEFGVVVEFGGPMLARYLVVKCEDPCVYGGSTEVGVRGVPDVGWPEGNDRHPRFAGGSIVFELGDREPLRVRIGRNMSVAMAEDQYVGVAVDDVAKAALAHGVGVGDVAVPALVAVIGQAFEHKPSFGLQVPPGRRYVDLRHRTES